MDFHGFPPSLGSQSLSPCCGMLFQKNGFENVHQMGLYGRTKIAGTASNNS